MPQGSVRTVRSEWISYLRVSTHEQAEKDLSLPAQRHAVEEYAARHGVQIAREYVEAGCSGTNSNRKAFRKCSRMCFDRTVRSPESLEKESSRAARSPRR